MRDIITSYKKPITNIKIYKNQQITMNIEYIHISNVYIYVTVYI